MSAKTLVLNFHSLREASETLLTCMNLYNNVAACCLHGLCEHSSGLLLFAAIAASPVVTSASHFSKQGIPKVTFGGECEICKNVVQFVYNEMKDKSSEVRLFGCARLFTVGFINPLVPAVVRRLAYMPRSEVSTRALLLLFPRSFAVAM